MDEWESVRQKIRELQGSFMESSPEVRSTLDTVSVADFWKRRYEDEKQLWEEKLSSKEKEHSQVQEKYLKDEEGIRELTARIRELEERMQVEKTLWDERSKIKLLEAELEKKKVEWEARFKTLDDENERLRTRIRKGVEESEESSRLRKTLESEKKRMEEDLKTLQGRSHAAALEEQKRAQALEQEKSTIQKQLQEFLLQKEESKAKSSEIEKELTILREESNRQLTQLGDREKQQFSEFEDLARGFAHKVRNYLGILSGTVQLCMANYKMDEELKRQLGIVDQTAQDMLRTIEEFLSLTRIPELSLQQMNVNEFLSNAVFTVEDLARAQNIRLDKKFSSDPLPPVPMDSNLLMEAFKQILVNAIEASPQGGTVTVSSSYEPHTGKVNLRISDSGKGITENQIKKIFQPYYTTKKGKKGMGLPIAKRAIDLHHGSLSIFSSKDQGTTVTVQIPVAKSQ